MTDVHRNEIFYNDVTITEPDSKFESQLCHFLTLSPWANLLNLSVPQCNSSLNIGMMRVPTSQSCSKLNELIHISS